MRSLIRVAARAPAFLGVPEVAECLVVASCRLRRDRQPCRPQVDSWSLITRRKREQTLEQVGPTESARLPGEVAEVEVPRRNAPQRDPHLHGVFELLLGFRELAADSMRDDPHDAEILHPRVARRCAGELQRFLDCTPACEHECHRGRGRVDNPAIAEGLGDADDLPSHLEDLVPASEPEEGRLAYRPHDWRETPRSRERHPFVGHFERSRWIGQGEGARQVDVGDVRLASPMLFEGECQGRAEVVDPARDRRRNPPARARAC